MKYCSIIFIYAPVDSVFFDEEDDTFHYSKPIPISNQRRLLCVFCNVASKSWLGRKYVAKDGWHMVYESDINVPGLTAQIFITT